MESKIPDDPRVPRQPASRPRWVVLRPIDLGDLAVQTVSVIIGILIALGVDDWSKAHESERKLTSARAAIREELTHNQKNLEDLIAYYDRFEKAAEAMHPTPTTEANGCQAVPEWKGVHTAQLLDNAYRTAVVSNVFADMDFSESQRIAGIYDQQTLLRDIGNKFLDWYIVKWSEKASAFPCTGLLSDLESEAKIINVEIGSYLVQSGDGSQGLAR